MTTRTTNPTAKIDRLWTIDDVSEFLGVPVATLYAWRSSGKGPASRRVGKYIRYRPQDVHAWVADLPTGVAS
ncbi:hypothetical protein GCM10028784_36970 [Myceligenerans cantabricum]